jgi:hypothetical protein
MAVAATARAKRFALAAFGVDALGLASAGLAIALVGVVQTDTMIAVYAILTVCVAPACIVLALILAIRSRRAATEHRAKVIARLAVVCAALLLGLSLVFAWMIVYAFQNMG